MLGIECDGASYHSGRSARDRDRLRQEILVNLGWKIHRVWSTDWFKSRDSEIKRLLRSIEGLLENDPAYCEQQQKVGRTESLRQRLVTLRNTEVTPAFPDSPAENGLLRNDLLEEFVEKRPKTRDDWFRMIPQQFRTTVDSKQVGRYLDRVLEIMPSATANSRVCPGESSPHTLNHCYMSVLTMAPENNRAPATTTTVTASMLYDLRSDTEGCRWWSRGQGSH